MNPETGKFEMLHATEPRNGSEELARRYARKWRAKARGADLVRPDGSPVPKHWSTYTVGEIVEIKGWSFTIAHIGESHILLEPAKVKIVGGENG